MKLHVEWGQPIPLRANRDGISYDIDLEKITDYPGVYVFGRRHGDHFEALYVGSSMNIRSRVKGHLNNLQLMKYLRTARTGKRILLAGRLITKRGQQVEKCIVLSERALIRHFLSEGHELVNKSGTKIRRHELESTGRHPKRLVPNFIYLERTRGD
jgi:hypothetical protein